MFTKLTTNLTLKLGIYEIHIFELRNEELNVKKILAVINATYAVACVAGVNGEGEGEREKYGVLRARDEGTPATKTPIFSSPPTDFYVIQLS